MFVLTMTLMAASSSHGEQELKVRYRPFSGLMSLTVSQDIEVPKAKEKPIATRNFSFDLTMAPDPAATAVAVTIEKAKASYTAHGMKERLGTRHLTGKNISLTIGDDGRKVVGAESSDEPVIDLGMMVDGGFSIGDLFANILPVFPEEAVAVGATWTTERQVRSLEGWAWGIGSLASRHRVTALDRRDGHTVVSGQTDAEAHLNPIEGQRSYKGVVKRTLRWTFDATDGRLLSVSMEQNSEGTSDLPQGEVHFRQQTRVELAPVS